MKAIEQRLKETLGEQLFALHVLQTELDKALARIAELEKPPSPPGEEKVPEKNNVVEIGMK